MVPMPMIKGSFFFSFFSFLGDEIFLTGTFFRYFIALIPNTVVKANSPAARNNNSSVPNAFTNGFKFIPTNITANDPPPPIIPKSRFACCGSNESAAVPQN